MSVCYKFPKACVAECKNRSQGVKRDLEVTVSEMEKRQYDLAHRRQYLNEKVANLEKTLPIIVAHGLWASGKGENKLTPAKIRELVDQLSPYPYPSTADKLVKETQEKLGRIDEEMKALQDKIIEADVKLEESEMELESLLQFNAELNNKLEAFECKALEHERRSKGLPNLHDIDPDDITCLGRIRQLVQNEIRLKNCIRVLEDRERRIQAQMNQLLGNVNEKSGGDRRKKDREKPPETPKKHNVCHCASEDSLTDTLSDLDSKLSDGSSGEEYCDCCNCEG